MDEAIKHTAILLKKLFSIRKEERDNKPYTPHKRFDDASCWRKTAQVVLSLGADPEDYIEAQFRFAKSVVFANTLHSSVAQKRWRRYMVVKNMKEDTGTQLPANPAPQQADLSGMLADFWHDLDYLCGSHDLTRRDVCAKVLDMRLRFDPLVVMLLGPTQEFKEVFGEAAKQRLEDEPHLRQAAIDLDLGEALDFLYA
jgi:hypothetical protein